MAVPELLDTKHDFCQAQKEENTDSQTNYAVKYATARGHLTLSRSYTTKTHECLTNRQVGQNSTQPLGILDKQGLEGSLDGNLAESRG